MSERENKRDRQTDRKRDRVLRERRGVGCVCVGGGVRERKGKSETATDEERDRQRGRMDPPGRVFACVYKCLCALVRACACAFV